MKLALFAELPVPKPWTKGKEQRLFKEQIEQAVFAEKMGFHSFWTVEHHFLSEMSHATNPEVLYGAIAALTSKLRLGYGVRLLPKPYNHPIRTAESVATLDLVSGGRVEFAGGRSGTARELAGFGINPHDTRPMQEEAFRAMTGIWMNEEYEFEGKFWSMPKRTVVPRVVQEPHPPLWCATGSIDGHYEVGKLGTGLLSFATCTPPEEMAVKFARYEEGLRDCTDPVGYKVFNRKAALAIGHCDDTDEMARAVGEPSMRKYLNYSFPLYAEMTEYAAAWRKDGGLGTYAYAQDIKDAVAAGGGAPQFDMDAIFEMGGHTIAGVDRWKELALRFEAVGTDILFCLMNTWEVPHEKIMHSIELIGKHVIPILEEREREREAEARSAVAAA
jgi:alkanesulfonate monooxygenase SsuD/methylene tetrahydromethanopterin reductase-like flavin-dependent oxidoreductase (luciferase family)